MEINTLAIILSIVIFVVGPGSGVYIGLRAAQKGERELREQALGTVEKSVDRIENALTSFITELRELRNRVSKNEGNIEHLEEEN